jgi:hypothetical protein
MIGSVFEERRYPPFAAVAWLLLAVVCLVIGVLSREMGWAIFAILPATLGVILLIARPALFRAELAADELCIHSSGQSLPYQQITAVQFVPVGTTGDRGSLHLTHQQGQVVIPANISISSIDLYFFLLSHSALVPVVDIPTAIAQYYHSQTTTFGEDRVWLHCVRSPVKIEGRVGKFIGPSLLLVAIAWLVLSFVLNEAGWFVAAILLGLAALPVWFSGYQRSKSIALRDDQGWLLVGLLFFPFGLLLYLGNRSRRAKMLRKAGMVISPAGLALIQGDLEGQMRWAELKKVLFRKGSLLRSPVVQLGFEGAKINILDIFETPIAEIHRQIEQYWAAG